MQYLTATQVIQHMYTCSASSAAFCIDSAARVHMPAVRMHNGRRLRQRCIQYHLLQALADYAVLIEKLKHAWESPDSAVIGFGGSYGGMLAAWFRMKYPNMLDGEQSWVMPAQMCHPSAVPLALYMYVVLLTPTGLQMPAATSATVVTADRHSGLKAVLNTENAS